MNEENLEKNLHEPTENPQCEITNDQSGKYILIRKFIFIFY
jgi:hypothetical protein